MSANEISAEIRTALKQPGDGWATKAVLRDALQHVEAERLRVRSLRVIAATMAIAAVAGVLL